MLKLAFIALLSAWAPAGAQQTPSQTLDALISTAPADAQSASRPPIEVIWPKDQDKFPFVTRSFTFGSTWIGSTLTVNGSTVPVDGSGAFFAMVPFSSGTFALDYSVEWLSQTVSTRRVVEVGRPYGLPELRPKQAVALEPASDLSLPPGGLLVVRCYGPAGAKAHFKIGGLADDLPMAERAGAPGLYEGHYILQPEDKGAKHKIVCALKTEGWGTVKAEAPGKLAVEDPSRRRVGVTTSRTTILKTLRGGYTLFLPAGVLLELVGKEGSMHRVSLADDYEGWVEEGGVSLLPEGTPPPRVQVGRSVLVSSDESASKVTVDADARLPFEIAESIEPLSFEVRFYGALQRFDRIRYSFEDPIVQELSWRQESTRVVVLRVKTRLSWGWGYDAYYDATGRFVLELRRAPDLTRSPNPLAGRRIIVDPGHGPQASAVGPLGTTERDVNLEIAQRLRRRLETEGAEVYMIRTSTEGPGLGERPFIAWAQRGDLYISIHNNALPVTADPLEKPRGFMTFYYQPHSLALAEAVHDAYRLHHPELADEGLQWGDLAVCRVTQMPSILTETAYMILPKQEVLLRDPAFLEKAARTMLDGIKNYLARYRSVQLSNDAERVAARR